MNRPRNIQIHHTLCRTCRGFPLHKILFSLEFTFLRFDPQDYGSQSNPTRSLRKSQKAKQAACRQKSPWKTHDLGEIFTKPTNENYHLKTKTTLLKVTYHSFSNAQPLQRGK